MAWLARLLARLRPAPRAPLRFFPRGAPTPLSLLREQAKLAGTEADGGAPDAPADEPTQVHSPAEAVAVTEAASTSTTEARAAVDKSAASADDEAHAFAGASETDDGALVSTEPHASAAESLDGAAADAPAGEEVRASAAESPVDSGEATAVDEVAPRTVDQATAGGEGERVDDRRDTLEVHRVNEADPRPPVAPQPPAAEAPAPRKRPLFRIEKTVPPYQPEVRARPSYEPHPEFRASLQDAGNSRYALYLLPAARQTIQKHIVWGVHTRENVNEQGGILVGRAYRDPVDGTTWALATAAVPGILATGSQAYVRFDHRTWVEMLKQVDQMPAGEDGPPQVIGWYHTHPGELAVFMSGTDRATQRGMFYADWHFAMVLNPHKRYWRVFHGAECTECDGFGVHAAPAAAWHGAVPGARPALDQEELR